MTLLFSGSALWLVGCATAEEDSKVYEPRDEALQVLEGKAGATVTLDINELGTTRVVAMHPRFPVSVSVADPALAATHFLREHSDVFQIDASDASNFVVTNFDDQSRLNMRHVTLQRVFSGIPVFQGGITVHLNNDNGVFHAVGDEFYRINAPTNLMGITPLEAAAAAGRAVGAPLTLTTYTTEGPATIFDSPDMADPVKVEPRIYQVAPGDNRYAYQVLLAWFDGNKEQHYEMTMVDAASGALLYRYNLVNTFTCRSFTANALPVANQAADNRQLVSCDGNATASPSGWVTAATRNTSGNNVNATTDLNANNAGGTNEIQPVANASDAFDFPYSGTTDAVSLRPAAVTSLFFLNNDIHDRLYALGFNEASRNFQLNNFGRGGAQNDRVNADAQDGSGTNNANFGTPPDGSSPRMQMFLFNIVNGAGGVRQDSDFDPSVVYHEYSHGLSNRLVGGGGGGCLGGSQSGGMGEGWGDFIGSSITGNPVVGGYVTGNTTTGIRDAAMNNSPFTYLHIQNGTRTQVHDAGEVWAAALWAARTRVGAAVINQLVVSGMKLTPCQPTMLQARDGIITADAQINGGANRCALWEAFASRQMGTGASSPNHNSTTQIVLSTAVPADCGGGGGGTTVFSDNFETATGWVTNAGGTDTATTGQWARANPEATNSGGVKQQGTTVSGQFDLVTGPLAGASAGVNDIDGGTTSILSPAITIPAGGTVTLSFSFYLAHGTNSSTADFFRAEIVGNTTAQVFQELGGTENDNAVFTRPSVNISQFAGQTIRIRFSAADAATASLVEAAVDDVLITRQ